MPHSFQLSAGRSDQHCSLDGFSYFISSCYLAATLNDLIFLCQLGRRPASSAMKKDIFISSWSKQEEVTQPPIPASLLAVEPLPQDGDFHGRFNLKGHRDVALPKPLFWCTRFLDLFGDISYQSRTSSSAG